MNNQNPYIGVTGVTSSTQARWLHQTYAELAELHLANRYDWPALMSGVLVSSKTLSGRTNRYPERYPAIGEIGSIFQPSARPDRYSRLNLIHFNTDTPEAIAEQVGQIIGYSGPFLGGFQFNEDWPEPEDIASIRRLDPSLYLVLQVSLSRLDQIGWEPARLNDQLLPYLDRGDEPIIQAVLLDPSGGRGRQLDETALLGFAHKLLSLEIDFGVAGGLSAETLGYVKVVRALHPYISVDAQSRLRDSFDCLDESKTRAYLEIALLSYRAGVDSTRTACRD